MTIEDSAELKLQQPHVVRLETRPANLEGVGEVKQRDLVRNALRMRPDRIIVGEVRGAEALDMLQAMNTGHEGSLTTIHANDTRDALTRLEMMVMMAGFDMPVPVIRQYIGSAITLVIQLSRLKGGPRRIMRISEIVAVKGRRYLVQGHFRLPSNRRAQRRGGRRVLRDGLGAAVADAAVGVGHRAAAGVVRRAHSVPAGAGVHRRATPLPERVVPAEVAKLSWTAQENGHD